MKLIDELSQYLDLLKPGLGNNARTNPSRHRSFMDYCKGLLVEWPEDEPTKYWFSTLPQSTSLQELVSTTKKRWHIERDYQELKDEIGLNHYEGRNWRGFHPGGAPHHATLCFASYAFLVGQRLTHPESFKKSPGYQKNLPYPTILSRGAPQRAQRHVEESISTIRWYIAQAITEPLKRCPCCCEKHGPSG